LKAGRAIKIRQQSQNIRQIWRSALGTRRVAYLGGPITSGMRFVDWYERTGCHLSPSSLRYKREHRSNVVEPNETDLKATAELLRMRDGEIVVEPASLVVKSWKQSDYVELWEGFIADHASRVIFMPGWEYSAGCAAEFCRAQLERIPTATIEGVPIIAVEGVAALKRALSRIEAMTPLPRQMLEALRTACTRLEAVVGPATIHIGSSENSVRKDASLDRLAELINVAQFVSFEPQARRPKQSYSRILGEEPNFKFRDLRQAAEVLLTRSAETSVNVRSFTLGSPLSREFIYGLKSVDEIISSVERLTNEGLNTILNETVDINDGGVSGVLLGNVIEFAPDDTPRAVEKAGIASLPSGWGRRLLASVYGFEPDLTVPSNTRLEFSIHPKPRGWRHTQTLGWEIAEATTLGLPATIHWPNRFSRMIGDKVFGLLVAHHIGLPVPRSTVVSRRVAPFSFGQPTGTNEIWFRTAPTDQVPGKYTTMRGWTDPFKILASEDPDHATIASVIAQAGVRPAFSGASIIARTGEIVTEGVHGSGIEFMLGNARPEELGQSVLADISAIHTLASELGAVRFEWVHDGNKAWVVQLHKGATISEPGILVPGNASQWISFNVASGLPALREVLANLKADSGLLLSGEVGLTSHIADVIRKARVPARMAPR